MTDSTQSIYKIVTATQWRQFDEQGRFTGNDDDHRDGYIHCSTAQQLTGTLEKHYSGMDGLVLLQLNTELCQPMLKWEPSRKGKLFPHIYGVLDRGWITAVYHLKLNAHGKHELPLFV